MLKFGTISEVMADKGLARVKFDDDGIVSAPLHVSAPSTLKDQAQFPFNVNQHVWCMMDDQCERGVIAGAVYDKGNPPASGAASIVRVIFDQGLEIKYDRTAKKLSVLGQGDVEVNIDGNVEVTASQDVHIIARQNIFLEADNQVTIQAPLTNIVGPLHCESIETTANPGTPGLHIDGNGNIVTNNNITANGTIEGGQVKQGAITLALHKHNGVTTGGGVSGTPIP
jgi:phage baseplate assembly protein gpV